MLASCGRNHLHLTCRQVLDRLPVEQQRGVTVRAHTATMVFPYKGKEYLLNLIDTPGHVDFNYEVKCSLAACQVRTHLSL